MLDGAGGALKEGQLANMPAGYRQALVDLKSVGDVSVGKASFAASMVSHLQFTMAQRTVAFAVCCAFHGQSQPGVCVH
jgi:hypothetical protein